MKISQPPSQLRGCRGSPTAGVTAAVLLFPREEPDDPSHDELGHSYQLEGDEDNDYETTSCQRNRGLRRAVCVLDSPGPRGRRRPRRPPDHHATRQFFRPLDCLRGRVGQARDQLRSLFLERGKEQARQLQGQEGPRARPGRRSQISGLCACGAPHGRRERHGDQSDPAASNTERNWHYSRQEPIGHEQGKSHEDRSRKTAVGEDGRGTNVVLTAKLDSMALLLGRFSQSGSYTGSRLHRQAPSIPSPEVSGSARSVWLAIR